MKLLLAAAACGGLGFYWGYGNGVAAGLKSAPEIIARDAARDAADEAEWAAEEAARDAQSRVAAVKMAALLECADAMHISRDDIVDELREDFIDSEVGRQDDRGGAGSFPDDY